MQKLDKALRNFEQEVRNGTDISYIRRREIPTEIRGFPSQRDLDNLTKSEFEKTFDTIYGNPETHDLGFWALQWINTTRSIQK